MSINTKLLAEICVTPGAPGFEQAVRELVLREVKDLCDEVEIDNMGNVYAIRRGKGPVDAPTRGHHTSLFGHYARRSGREGTVLFRPNAPTTASLCDGCGHGQGIV